MALYRSISMSFWTDSKVVDDFTPEDRYFYLYLFTNPHTSLSGCYEISIKQVSLETGYTPDAIKSLISRFCNTHDIIRYSPETKEVLLLNWHKYNWTASEKFRKPLLQDIKSVKSDYFKNYLMTIYNGKEPRCIDTVSDQGRYGMDTSNANANTNTVTNTVTNTNTKSLEKEFEEVWELYPRKQGKTKSKEKYIKARKEGTTKEEVINGIKNYLKYIESTRLDDKYIKQGSTYFNNRSWLDEYKIKSGKAALKAWAEGESNGQEADGNIIDVSSEFIS